MNRLLQCLFNAYFFPGTVLGLEDVEVNKTNKNSSSLHRIFDVVRKSNNKTSDYWKI